VENFYIVVIKGQSVSKYLANSKFFLASTIAGVLTMEVVCVQVYQPWRTKFIVWYCYYSQESAGMNVGGIFQAEEASAVAIVLETTSLNVTSSKSAVHAVIYSDI